MCQRGKYDNFASQCRVKETREYEENHENM